MYKGNNQVEDIINAAKVSIFFIDEKQIIRPEDIGTLEEISRVAELHGAKIDKLNLKAQFRCSGAEGYINWVDDVLNIEETGNYDGWDKQDLNLKSWITGYRVCLNRDPPPFHSVGQVWGDLRD